MAAMHKHAAEPTALGPCVGLVCGQRREELLPHADAPIWTDAGWDFIRTLATQGWAFCRALKAVTGPRPRIAVAVMPARVPGRWRPGVHLRR